MKRRVQTVFTQMGLFLSACLAVAGLVGFVIVSQMGILPSHNPLGHSKEFEQGWALFFFLLLGIPCLMVFFGGLTPWIVWFMRSRKNTAASADGSES